MLCTEIDFDIQNNICKQHVLPMFFKKKELLTKIYLYSATLTISNIGSNEADYQHFLQIRHPDIESPKEHW